MKAAAKVSSAVQPEDDHALSNHLEWLIGQARELAKDEVSRLRLEGDLSLCLTLAQMQERELIDSRLLLERVQYQLQGRMDQ